MSHSSLIELKARLADDFRMVCEHPIYGTVETLEQFRRFMEFHVAAVWDFMSLLKELQRRLTCVRSPWLPSADPLARRLVNAIVLEEESDQDGTGGYASHYELYLAAMRDCGAETRAVEQLCRQLEHGRNLNEALDDCGLPSAAQDFVRATFATIETGDEMPRFVYYLQRYVELDGETHGPLAEAMLIALCGDDAERWLVAEQTARAALQARANLWDGVLQAVASS